MALTPLAVGTLKYGWTMGAPSPDADEACRGCNEGDKRIFFNSSGDYNVQSGGEPLL